MEVLLPTGAGQTLLSWAPFGPIGGSRIGTSRGAPRPGSIRWSSICGGNHRLGIAEEVTGEIEITKIDYTLDRIEGIDEFQRRLKDVDYFLSSVNSLGR